MEPHSYYDMTKVGAKSQPIVATAFRSRLNPEHRVFCSLLMTDYFDPVTRGRIEALSSFCIGDIIQVVAGERFLVVPPKSVFSRSASLNCLEFGLRLGDFCYANRHRFTKPVDFQRRGFANGSSEFRCSDSEFQGPL